MLNQNQHKKINPVALNTTSWSFGCFEWKGLIYSIALKAAKTLWSSAVLSDIGLNMK